MMLKTKKVKLTVIFIAILTVLFLLLLGHSQVDRRPWVERKSDLTDLTIQAKPVIEAIRKFHLEKGFYPDSLNELVPSFIDSIPIVNKPSIKHFELEYVKGEGGQNLESYKLSILTPRSFLNFDEIFYWPSEKYPDVLQNQKVERVLNWAYLHE